MEGDCSVVVSPRPVPVFDHDGSFTQRKRTPYKELKPPRAPTKVSTPVSRVFRTPKWPSSAGPRQVSFKSNNEGKCSMTSPHYNNQTRKSYFEQCFRVCEKLGEGSFGEVFRVLSCDDGKMYAVKKSHQQFKGKTDRRWKLVEVEKHEQLPHHPNCIKFYKAWEERQKLYIQMELCKMSLSEYADEHGPISEQRVWQMLADSVKGLKHLHEHMLCHLDIKPANIFLGVDGQTCKLGDFGLCTSVDQGFVEAMEGDARYLAPEVMKHHFGKEADIFSLGISMLELASDVDLPSHGENWHRLRHGQIPPQLTKGLSCELTGLFSRMMHLDPAQRPTVADIMADLNVLLPSHQAGLAATCPTMLTGSREVGTKSVAMAGGTDRSTCAHHCNGDAVAASGQMVHHMGYHKDCFSDDEEGSCQSGQVDQAHRVPSEDQQWVPSEDQQSQLNRSWIRHSPMKYPSPVYSGPPIPLDFGDSSFDSSPDRPKHSSPAKPRRAVEVEPRNLFEAFKDADL